MHNIDLHRMIRVTTEETTGQPIAEAWIKNEWHVDHGSMEMGRKMTMVVEWWIGHEDGAQEYIREEIHAEAFSELRQLIWDYMQLITEWRNSK